MKMLAAVLMLGMLAFVMEAPPAAAGDGCVLVTVEKSSTEYGDQTPTHVARACPGSSRIEAVNAPGGESSGAVGGAASSAGDGPGAGCSK